MHFKIKIVERTFESKRKRGVGEYIILRFVLFETKTDSEKRPGVVTLGDDTDWWHNSKE